VIIPALAFVVAVRMLWLRPVRDQPWLFAWIAIAALGCFYIAGEEASWGQHYLGWVTPESWSTINDQGETNLHNISSWFDQKPRSLLEIGVVVGGILVPIFAYFRPRVRRYRFAIILPPAICLPTALLAEFSMGSERAVELLGGSSYLFSRASEVQEIYFYWFILLYLIVVERRLRARSEAGMAETGGRPAVR
jgi:ABC-type branched-subunit amino acid transport system permease subunit